jgi:aerobic-type carbon monoxide dehydrogenase small subunit (CoxS/CutS family)
MTRLRVNGQERELTTHSRAALLWALRDELGCSSVKYGCGVEQCGACRILIDGVPASACAVTVGAAAGRDVTTLEGLVRDERASRVVDAMIALDAGQCGYCLPGIVTTLVALGGRSVTAPSHRDVVRALDAHLCRCGAQTRIVAAARAALGCGR